MALLALLSRRLCLATALCLLVPGPAAAWDGPLMESLSRDARRLVPRTLARLLGEREEPIYEAVRRFPAPLAQALAGDLLSGRLSPATQALLDERVERPVTLIRERRVSEALVELGALLRIPADLADPVLSAGSSGLPPGVARSYYAFVGRSLGSIPVVLEDEAALELGRAELGAYWQRVIARSRAQAPVIRYELFRGGRLVDQRRIDYRNPLFGVASLSYSRAVNGIAATWMAVWRELRGDLTRIPTPREIDPLPGPGPESSSASLSALPEETRP